MNYGKMAYLKQEELEARLNESAQNEPVKRSVYLGSAQTAGERVKLFNAAAACFILNISFLSGQEGAKISLYADNKLISTLPYSQNVTFTVALDETRQYGLFVESDCPFSVGKAEILVLRGSVNEPESAAAIDILNGKYGFVRSAGGQILFSVFGKGLKPQINKLIGFGAAVDLTKCALNGKDCFCVAVLDSNSNFFLIFIAADYTVLDVKFVVKGAESVSVSYAAGCLLCAYVKEGRAVIKSVFNKDSMSVAAEDVYLIKDCLPMMAVLKQNGINYLRICADELFLSKELTVAVTATLT